MVIKINRIVCICTILAGVFGLPVFSQEEDFTNLTAEENSREFYSYIRENENGERHFIQHLSWQGSDYVRYYEVIIERKEADGYSEILRVATGETFIEFSFSGGSYRYRIQIYDLLNRPSGSSSWKEFNIITILPPEISGFSPGELKRGKKEPRCITITGRNFSSHGRVFLRNQKDGSLLEASLVQIDSSARTIRMTFAEGELVSGNYDICVVNPGEFESSAGTLVIASGTFTGDFTVSAGFSPLIPLYGNLFDLFTPVSPVGVSARFAMVPFKTRLGSFGFELNPFWNYLSVSRDDYKGTSHLAGIHVNLLYQKKLPAGTMFINARLGCGVTSVLGFHFTYANGSSRSLNGFYVSAGTEISFQWFVFKFLYLEAGLAYRHIITTKEPSRQGYISPFMGAGIQF
ncbi:MAG: hypothetical protein LBI67_09270 [Treponema sp.]|jgi:hypothetical protein|nr:hypothetical protein [Treponema sp.]